jgi:tRNA(adenine34) deaminase
VRAPETCFDALLGYPWQPNYISDLATLGGLRMHHIDEGPRDAPVTWLCLHSSPTWSYLYRKMVPVFLAHGGRVVAPDLIGFGRSDKPKKPGAHTGSWHRDALLEWIERLDLRHVVLVLHGDAGVLGLTLPLAAAHRYHGLLAMNVLLPSETPTPDAAGACEQHPPWKHNPDLRVGDLLARSHPQLRPAERAAYDAPFPDRGHRAVLRASPMDQPLPGLARETQAFWQHRWSGRSMIAISAQGAMPEGIAPGSLLRAVRHGDKHLTLPEAGYWIPEQGEGLALQACRFFAH